MQKSGLGWVGPKRSTQDDWRSRGHGPNTPWFVAIGRNAVLRSGSPIRADEARSHGINVELSAGVIFHHVQPKPQERGVHQARRRHQPMPQYRRSTGRDTDWQAYRCVRTGATSLRVPLGAAR
jgi:hypothetical protein